MKKKYATIQSIFLETSFTSKFVFRLTSIMYDVIFENLFTKNRFLEKVPYVLPKKLHIFVSRILFQVYLLCGGGPGDWGLSLAPPPPWKNIFILETK